MIICPKCKKCFFYKSYYIEHKKMSSSCDTNNIDKLLSKYNHNILIIIKLRY